jgi:hypothetical protein
MAQEEFLDDTMPDFIVPKTISRGNGIDLIDGTGYLLYIVRT